MRGNRLLILTALLMLNSGCSYLIGMRGVNFNELDSQEKIEAHIGHPRLVTQADDKTIVTYRTRRKLASIDYYVPAGNFFMGYCATLGTVDLIFTPIELYRMVSGLVLGSDVRVTYTKHGVIYDVFVNGKEWHLDRNHGAEKPPENSKVGN